MRTEYPASAAETDRLTFSRRLAISLVMLTFLCLLCIPFFLNPTANNPPVAANGEISFAGQRDYGRPFDLNGKWMMRWQSTLPGSPPLSDAKFPVRVPGFWTGQKTPEGFPLPRMGHATYSLTIKDLRPGDYRLYVPILYGSSQLRLNGRIVSSNGRISSPDVDSNSEMVAHDFAFAADGSDLLLEIELRNLGHNGFQTAPVLGEARAMRPWMVLSWSQEMLFHVALTLLGAFNLTLFLFRRSDRASFFAGLACFLFLPSSMYNGFDNMLLMVAPWLSSRAALALVDLGGTGAVLAVLIYIQTLFGEQRGQMISRLLGAVVALFLIGQGFNYAFSSIELTSRFNSYSMYMQLAVFLFIVFILARAAILQRDGAVPILIGMGLFFAAILFTSMIVYGTVRGDLAGGINFPALGVLVMLFSHLIVIAERWSQTINASEARNEELRQLIDVNASIASEMELKTLLNRIVEVNSRILHAERSSLFLHDSGRGDLWSLVAEGMDTREIRIRADQGIAGAAFTSGQPVAVDDAYEDPRFNPAIDVQTGFRTRSILALPIIARDGRKLGVMQALNREGGSFSEGDITRMQAFAAQAAVSIDNATLFSEVVSARNYNESILGSMASGMITLGTNGRIAKCNSAALRIFRTSEDMLVGRNVRSLLRRANPRLLAEVDAVRTNSETRTLLDTEIIAGDGSAVSANISIVPLDGEQGDGGQMLLIEDISDGKRMEGTMRRFMPQEVVKEVLGRGEDLMFGTAIPASVLFADIRSFTTMAEALSPRETVDMLNEIFTDLFEAVASTDGMIDKYMGDAIMAVYGAPFPGGQDAVNAVAGAIGMIRMIEALNHRRGTRGQPPLRLGVGIASGEVVAGTIGSPKRMDYTVIGDSVNLASRLQDATKIYRVNAITCDRTAAKIGDSHRLRPLDLIRVRGRTQPTRIYEIAEAGDVSDPLITAYRLGLDAVDARDWTAAGVAFGQALKIAPDDYPSQLMRERVAGALADPPGAEWDGVW